MKQKLTGLVQSGSKIAITSALLSGVLPLVSAAQSGPTVTTSNGPVTGVAISGSSPVIDEFLGIPYAAPPVGALRFRPPQPHASWTKPIQATSQPAPCLQLKEPSGTVTGSEDCLYLDIYVPAAAASAPRPVMVFIPGGGFVQGSISEPIYNGQAMAEQSGNIVVFVDYRLGALGYLTAPALDAESPYKVSGNYGLEDQQAALQWVKSNIAAFGGAPYNVTLFGESAGANATEYQLVSPMAAGLFQHAIVESAVGVPLIPDLPLVQSESGPSANVIANVGCSGSSNVAACLRAVPAANFLNKGLVTNATVYPVVDGVVLPQAPLQAFQSGKFNKVPVIIGSNHDEFTTLIALTFPSAVNPPLTAATYATLLQQLFGSNASAVEAQYPVSAYQSPLQAFAAVTTDAYIACQTEQKRSALAKYVAVYGYEFNEPNPAQGPIYGPPITGLTYGDYHTSELPYVFGVNALGVLVSGKDVALSKSIISYWTTFASYAVPSSVPTSQTPLWPIYAQEELQSLKDQIAPITVASFDANHHCSFWISTVGL